MTVRTSRETNMNNLPKRIHRDSVLSCSSMGSEIYTIQEENEEVFEKMLEELNEGPGGQTDGDILNELDQSDSDDEQREESRRKMEEKRSEEVGGEEDWKNLAMEICRRELGRDSYIKRLAKYAKVKAAGIGSKTRLSYETGKLKRAVRAQDPMVQHHNGVGAFGYAMVLDDPRVPENNFFSPGKRFRIRLRHCAVRCDDDAASCVRQAALKFSDQNEDGPLDLVMHTGRTALARNCKSFVEVLNKRTPEDTKSLCMKDPHFYYAMVDGLRKAPGSYANLRYYSQIPYLLKTKDEKPRLVKFRLVPAEALSESGLLEENDQSRPWRTSRCKGMDKPLDYLRREFVRRLEDTEEGVGSVYYLLQMQVNNMAGNDESILWNPQMVWDESKHPWINLVEMVCTTALPPITVNRTYFNIVNRPRCLQIHPATSVWDYKSYHYAVSQMQTTSELDHIDQGMGVDEEWDSRKADRVSYLVTLSTRQDPSKKSKVIVFITLTGTDGRTTPKKLEKRVDKFDGDPGDVEHYNIKTEPVGEILVVTLGIRHRHLTDDWFLKYVSLSDMDRTNCKHFPCQRAVQSKITLRPGDVKLPNQEHYEEHKQERMLELKDKQSQYLWKKHQGLPSTIKGETLKDLPLLEQLVAEKYLGLPWDMDFTMDEFDKTSNQTYANQANKRSSGVYSRSVSHEETSSKRNSLKFNSLPNRRLSAPPSPQIQLKRMSLTVKAQEKWRKLRNCLHFITKVGAKIPDGHKGELCKAVNEDVDFGRFFQTGFNPTVLRRCSNIPDKFPVNKDHVEHLLDRNISLEQELKLGHIYMVDYEVLSNLPCYQRDAEKRYLVAPICLLYLKESKELVPLAIQLNQDPGPDNPIWTPNDNPEDWLLVKLWVRCADFQLQFANHMLHCHLVVEPFVIATMRQLSTSHPIFKLLMPHFRYILSGNTLMRIHVLGKGGAIDKRTSMGDIGYQELVRRLFSRFHMDDLDLPRDLSKRGVENSKKLPNYYYRDDGMRLWDAISRYVVGIVEQFYTSNDVINDDNEIQQWICDVIDKGFPSRKGDDMGLPSKLTSVSELADLLTKLLFACTVKHAATHSDAMDMYGFEPKTPACMCASPPTQRGQTKKDVLSLTLPEQDADRYNASVAYVMSLQKADEHSLGSSDGTFFVETGAKGILEDFNNQLKFVSKMMTKRNIQNEHPYEVLLAENIPNSVEPLPFMPDAKPEIAGRVRRHEGYYRPGSGASPSVPLLTLPICMQFARSAGGRSTLGRRFTVNMFSRAMSSVQMDRVNVPMNAIDRRKFGFQRMHYSEAPLS